METTKQSIKAKKSVKLADAEHDQFVRFVNDRTQEEAGNILGVHRLTIQRVYFLGQGSPKTIEKIRTVLKQKNRQRKLTA